MEKALKEYLREDENILWQSQPVAFPLMENGFKFRILRSWLIAIALLGALLVTYCTRNDQWSMGFVGAVVILGAMIIVSPLWERRAIMKQKYFITDQRAILMMKDKSLFSMELSAVDDYRLVSDMANQDCLVLGSSLFGDIRKQLRWRTCHPNNDRQSTNNQDRVDGVVFYGISNAQAAVELLHENSSKIAA